MCVCCAFGYLINWPRLTALVRSPTNPSSSIAVQAEAGQ